jgi:hypothetical protein
MFRLLIINLIDMKKKDQQQLIFIYLKAKRMFIKYTAPIIGRTSGRFVHLCSRAGPVCIINLGIRQCSVASFTIRPRYP